MDSTASTSPEAGAAHRRPRHAGSPFPVARVVAGVAVSAALMTFASAPLPVIADSVDATISGGGLRATLSGSIGGITSGGAGASAGSFVWRITDARGSGRSWALSVSCTPFTSGSANGPAISPAALTIDAVDVRAEPGADPAATITGHAVALSTSPQVIVSAAGPNKGAYTVSPSFRIELPADVQQAIGSEVAEEPGLDPLVATLTYTVG